MLNPKTRIETLFSDTTYNLYLQKRFGIRTCKNQIDQELAADLRELLSRATEMETCGQHLGGSCSKLTIEERINTL